MTTKSFVTVWTVSLAELEDVGRTYPQVKVRVRLMIGKNQHEHRSKQQRLLMHGFYIIRNFVPLLFL